MGIGRAVGARGLGGLGIEPGREIRQSCQRRRLIFQQHMGVVTGREPIVGMLQEFLKHPGMGVRLRQKTPGGVLEAMEVHDPPLAVHGLEEVAVLTTLALGLVATGGLYPERPRVQQVGLEHFGHVAGVGESKRWGGRSLPLQVRLEQRHQIRPQRFADVPAAFLVLAWDFHGPSVQIEVGPRQRPHAAGPDGRLHGEAVEQPAVGTLQLVPHRQPAGCRQQPRGLLLGQRATGILDVPVTDGAGLERGHGVAVEPPGVLGPAAELPDRADVFILRSRRETLAPAVLAKLLGRRVLASPFAQVGQEASNAFTGQIGELHGPAPRHDALHPGEHHVHPERRVPLAPQRRLEVAQLVCQAFAFVDLGLREDALTQQLSLDLLRDPLHEGRQLGAHRGPGAGQRNPLGDVASEFLAGLLAGGVNTPAGFARIVEGLQEAQVALVVIESTGGLEKKLIAALLEQGLPVTLVQPGRVRHFAQAKGLLAKTDALDAALLVRFGQSLLHDAKDTGEPVRLVAQKPENRQLLSELLVARRQLVEARAVLDQQLKTTTAQPAAKALGKVLATTDKQIADLDRQIARLIDEDQSQGGLGQTAAILRSVPGVGPVLAAVLLARLPELGTLSRQAAAQVLGLAPLAQDSGARNGPRHIRGGRQDVRNVLYMAAVAAMRCNPYIRAFAERLTGRGKVFKVVVTARMRKLVVLLNAMVRDGTTFTPDQATVAT